MEISGFVHEFAKMASQCPGAFALEVYALEWTGKDYAFFMDGKETWQTVGGGVCEHPGYLKLTTESGKWAAPIVPEQLPDFCQVDWVRVWQEV